MQATAQKPSASPKKKIGWGEGEVDKNEVTRWWLFSLSGHYIESILHFFQYFDL